MKQKLKNVIKILEDLEFDKDFRNMIDNEDKFQKFDHDMVFFIEILKAILGYKYGVSPYHEDKKERLSEQERNIQRVDAQTKGVKW